MSVCQIVDVCRGMWVSVCMCQCGMYVGVRCVCMGYVYMGVSVHVSMCV